MKKKLFLLLLVLTINCPLKTTFAEQTQSIPFLISSEQKQIDGSIFLTKIYEVAEDFDPSKLIENGYEKEGYLFAYHKTDKKVNENKQTKDLSECIAIETATDNKEKRSKELAVSLPGDLSLDSASKSSKILTIVIGTIFLCVCLCE